MKTYSSACVSSRVLSQQDNNKLLHLVLILSKSFTLVKCNYKIYDEKPLIMIQYFKQLRLELERTRVLIKVIT